MVVGAAAPLGIGKAKVGTDCSYLADTSKVGWSSSDPSPTGREKAKSVLGIVYGLIKNGCWRVFSLFGITRAYCMLPYTQQQQPEKKKREA